jgi:hypothetical protein
MTNKKNFIVKNEGTIFLIIPVSRRAKKWVAANVQIESWQWLGGGFGVDHRCAENLLEGMENDLGGIEYL